MLTEGLGITHLRLIMGTSMGCMHSFMWGEAYPDFASALMPLACEPIEIAGLNRMWRQLVINGIEADPAWRGGNYTDRADAGAADRANRCCSSPAARRSICRRNIRRAPRRARYAEERVATAHAGTRRQRPDLPVRIVAELQSVAGAGEDHGAGDVDQFGRRFHQSAQPRRVRSEALKRMPNARFRLIPESADTHGHGTHTWAKFWKSDLSALLARSERDVVGRNVVQRDQPVAADLAEQPRVDAFGHARRRAPADIGRPASPRRARAGRPSYCRSAGWPRRSAEPP